MTAIITDTLKKQLLLDIITDIDSAANDYYIGVGRSETWDGTDTAPTPKNSQRDTRNLGLSLQSVKAVADKSLVVPRTDWSSGATYSSWNDNIEGHPVSAYYVFTDENHVYICLQAGRNASGNVVNSTVKPTGTSTNAFKAADGYVWKFLFSIGALTASKFLSANFLPVTFITETDSDSPASIVEQKGIQDAAVPGEIVGYTVTAGGTGYTSTPTATIVGNGGTLAKADVTVSGGAVSKLDARDSSGTLVFGAGYTYASITLSGGGGTGASVRPIFGPKSGVGADPRDDLKTRAIMFNTKPEGIETGDFIVGNDFRQVTLIKNPLTHAGAKLTDNTGNALNRLNLSTISTIFSADKTILGGTSGAKAYIDKVDSDNIYYHQNETTGFIQFEEAESISETDGSGSGVLALANADGDTDAFINGDLNPLSGDILYIDNRAAVTRSAEQTEDIKIVIQL
tara:strand:- start:199 stop:1566 length:1368 start_codon:yes stop_codon:yes gene_type:complete